MLKDLRLHHPDYEPNPLPAAATFRLPTDKELEQFKQENPEKWKKQQETYQEQYEQIRQSEKQRNDLQKVEGAYQSIVEKDGISDAELILLSDDKAQEMVNALWEAGNGTSDPRKHLSQKQYQALARQVEQTTGFKKDIERSAGEYGGLDALKDNDELKDRVKSRVLNERITFGINQLSPEQKQLYDLQVEKAGLLSKLSEPLTPDNRAGLSTHLNELDAQITEARQAFPTLFDPLTGTYVDPNDATEDQKQRLSMYEKKVQQELVKYKQTDLGSLIKSWNQLQSNLKYITDHLGDEEIVEVDGKKMSVNEVFQLKQEIDKKNYGFGPPITGDAADKLYKYWDVYAETRAKFDAVNRALLLNQDPAAVDKNFAYLFGEHAVEGFDLDIKTDKDFIEDFVAGIKETGGVLTQAQEDAAKDDLSDQIAKGLGDSVRPMVELILTAFTTRGLGTIPTIAKWRGLLQTALASRWGKQGELAYNILKNQLQGTLSFGLATDDNLSAMMGTGEGTVQGIMDSLNPVKWFKKSKYAKLFDLGTRTFAGMTGETAQEFAGEYLDNLNRNGFNWEQAFEDTFGRTPDEFADKLLVIAAVSGMYSGGFNTGTALWARTQIEQSDSPHKKEYLEIIDKVEKPEEAKPVGETEETTPGASPKETPTSEEIRPTGPDLQDEPQEGETTVKPSSSTAIEPESKAIRDERLTRLQTTDYSNETIENIELSEKGTVTETIQNEIKEKIDPVSTLELETGTNRLIFDGQNDEELDLSVELSNTVDVLKEIYGNNPEHMLTGLKALGQGQSFNQLRDEEIRHLKLLEANEIAEGKEFIDGKLDNVKVGDPNVNPNYKTGKKIPGKATKIRMPNKEVRKSEFAVVEADNIIASHDEMNFGKSKGYPTEHGSNINPRNYKGDKVAQHEVIQNARELDPYEVISNAVNPTTGPPIISSDGIVLSGNGRTMSIKRAIQEFPERFEAYRNYLMQEGEIYGIDPNEIQQMQNPVLVKIDQESQDYTVKELDKYNKKTQKEEAQIDQAIKLGKILESNPDAQKRILEVIGEFDTMGEFFADRQSQEIIKGVLQNEEIILGQELNKYVDADGQFNKGGKDLIQDVLLSQVLNEQTLKASDLEGVKQFRRNIVNSIPVLVKNYTLGEFSIKVELNEAVLIQAHFAQSDVKDFLTFATQQQLFGKDKDPNVLILNRAINLGQRRFKEVVQNYNGAAELSEAGGGLFGDQEVLDKDDIILKILDQKLEPHEQEAIRKVISFSQGNAAADESRGNRGTHEDPGGKQEGKPNRGTESSDPQKGQQEEPVGATLFQTRKHFANYVDSFSTAERIQPSPIKGAPPKRLQEIILDLSKGTGRKILYSKAKGKRRPLGSYNPATTATHIKYAGDLDTTAHEIGHALDDRFGILARIPKDQLTRIDNELSKFWIHGSKPPKNHPDPTRYLRGEGVAEWIRAYVVNPGEAIKAAPGFYRWYDTAVSDSVKEKISQFSRDVRTFSGATAHEQILSNVEFEPDKSENIIAKAILASKQLLNKQKVNDGFTLGWQDRVAQKWLNPLRPLESAFEYAMGEKGITEVLPKDDIRITARLFLGIQEKIEDLFENGMVSGKNERLIDKKTNKMMNLRWLLKPLDQTDEGSIKKDMKAVISYMIAERTVELPVKFQRRQVEEDLKNGLLPPREILELHPDIQEKYAREIQVLETRKGKPRGKNRYLFTEKVLTGIGGGLYKDVDVAQKRLEEFEKLKEFNPGKYHRIKEAARRYREFSDAGMRYMVEKGRISEEQYREIKRNNLQYVALKRIMQAGVDEDIVVITRDAKGKLGLVAEPIKRIKGSARTIQNPYAALLDFVHKAVREADRNDIMLAFREMLTSNRDLYQGNPMRLADVGRQVSEKESQHTIKIFVNGQPEIWQFEPDVYQALKDIRDAAYRLPLFLTILPSILRWSVTHFPVFGVRNWTRDTQNRLVVTQSGSGLRHFFGKKEDAQRFRLFGGGQAGYYIKDRTSYYRQLEETMEKLAKNKRFILIDPKRMFKKGWRFYERAIQATETGNRVAEFRSAYKKAKKQGMDDYNANLYAAFQARDLLDFAIIGEYMHIINQMAPFSNAAVQGIRKTVRSAKTNPKAFFIRWALFALVPAILNRILVGLGDDEDEYQELPNYQRDLFYNFKVGPDQWLTIPKPFELGVIASSGDRLLDRALGNEEAFDGYAGSVFRSLAPVDEGALTGPFRGLMETVANYDFFRGKHLVPPKEKNKALELRHTHWGSRLGQTVQKIAGVDARLIDHFIKSNLSYFGEKALQLSDIGRDDTRYDFDLSDTGIFRNSPVYTSKHVQEVMKMVKEYGLERDSDYLEMNRLIRQYFETESKALRDEQGEVIRDFAKELLGKWEDEGVKERKMEKFKEKQARKQ